LGGVLVCSATLTLEEKLNFTVSMPGTIERIGYPVSTSPPRLNVAGKSLADQAHSVLVLCRAQCGATGPTATAATRVTAPFRLPSTPLRPLTASSSTTAAL
jgi:hypothetical protein